MDNVIDLNKVIARYLYWSNSCGDLHHHAEYDITFDELPAPLQRVATDLFCEGQFYMRCYLTEFQGEYGISLEAEYDTEYARDLGTSYEKLTEVGRKKAAILAEEFPEYKVMFGYDTMQWESGERTSQLVIFLPADISAEEYKRVGDRADEIVWPTPEECEAQNNCLCVIKKQ